MLFVAACVLMGLWAPAVSALPPLLPIPPIPPIPPGPLPPPPEARTQVLVSWPEPVEFNPCYIHTMQLDGDNIEYLATHASPYERDPSSAAAGGAVYVSGDGNAAEVYYISPDRSIIKRITQNSVPDLYPALAPDGTKIAFCRPDPTLSNALCLFVADFAPSQASPLSNLRQISYSESIEPCFSPDNKWVASSDAWVPPGTNKAKHCLRASNLRREGTEPAVKFMLPSSYNNFDQHKPAWSPDGRVIALALEKSDASFDLALVSATGGAPVLYTNTPDRDEGFSAWHPAGGQLVFEALHGDTRTGPRRDYSLMLLDVDANYVAEGLSEVREVVGYGPGGRPHSAWTLAPRAGILENELPAGTAGVPYQAGLRAYGGEGVYRWQLKSGSALPAGLSLDSWGEITGTPTAPTGNIVPARFTVILRDKNNTGTPVEKQLSMFVNPASGLTLALGAQLPTAIIGQVYRCVLPISGGVPPYSVSVTFYPSGDYGHQVTLPGLTALQISTAGDPDCGKWAIVGNPQASFPTGSGMTAGSSVAGPYLAYIRVGDSRGAAVARGYPDLISFRILGDIPEQSLWGFAGDNVRQPITIPGSTGLEPEFMLKFGTVEFGLRAAVSPGNAWAHVVGPLPTWAEVARWVRLSPDQETIPGQVEITLETGGGELTWQRPINFWRYAFRYQRGFPFTNYSSTYTWDAFERFFGSDDCEYAGSGIDTGVASLIYDQFVGPADGLGSGTCFGMSLSGEKIWNGVAELFARTPPPGSPAWNYQMSTYVPFEAPLDIGGYCTRQHLWQLDEEYLRAWVGFYLAHQDDMGRATLEAVRASVQRGTPQWPYLMAIAKGLGAAHTMVAYAVEDLPDGWARIKVYDPNKPFDPNATCDDDSSIYVDPRQPNRWQYDLGGETWGDVYIIPVQSEICQGDPDLISDLGEALGLGLDFLWCILSGSVSTEQVTDASGRTMFTSDGKPNFDAKTRIRDAGLVPALGGSGKAGLVFAPRGGAYTFKLRSGADGKGYSFGFFTADGAVVNIKAQGGGAALDTVRCDAAAGMFELTPGAARQFTFQVLDDQADAGSKITLSQVALGTGQGVRLTFDGGRILLRPLGGQQLNFHLGMETASSSGREAQDYGDNTQPGDEQWNLTPGAAPGEPPAPFEVQVDRGADGTVDETRTLLGENVPPGGTGPATTLTFQIGSQTMQVNGVAQAIDVPPSVVEGRTLLPVRWLAEPLGAKTAWDPNERKVTVTLGSTRLELWVGRGTAVLNGREVLIDPQNPKVVPLIINGRTMMPMRFVAESLGCKVGWDPATKTITITYGGAA